MSDTHAEGPLRPGDHAPNIVLDAITREGKISLDDYRGRPILIGLFRGLHCPFCRRHLAAQAQIDGALREKGVESLSVVNTPMDRAKLYFRYHPIPNLFAAADPERTSHRAFGLPTLEFTENETVWPRKIGMNAILGANIEMPELPEPMNRMAAGEVLNARDGYEITKDDERMLATGSNGQLFGQFLLDRNGIVRWSFTEFPEDGRHMFGKPSRDEVMTAAQQLVS